MKEYTPIPEGGTPLSAIKEAASKNATYTILEMHEKTMQVFICETISGQDIVNSILRSGSTLQICLLKC
jgi:hypothetical protein